MIRGRRPLVSAINTMRFHSRHPSASYLGKRSQMRMLRMVGLLIVVMVGIRVAGRATFWAWMFPDEQNGAANQPVEPPETVDPKKFQVRTDDGIKLRPGEFIAAADPVIPMRVAVAEPGEGDAVQFEPGLFSPVRDNTLGIRHDERAAYYTVLAKARELSAESMEKLADPDVSFVVLMNQSPQFRGKLITVRGEIRRLLPFAAGKNEQGIEDLWEAWFFTRDRPQDPYRIVCLEIPPGIPRSDGTKDLKDAVPVRITGFFFKIEGYSGRSGLHTAPLLLAKTVKWLPPPPLQESDNETGLWIVGVVCLTAVGLAVTFWRISTSDRKSKKRNFYRYYEPRPEVLDSLKSLETDGETDMFRHLYEDDGEGETGS